VHQSIIARGCDTEKRAGNLRLAWIEAQRGRYSTGAIALKLERLAMRPPRDYGWNPIETAPLDEDVALQVTDGRGGPYTLQWPCRRAASGWINSRKGTPLEVTPVRWRPYPIPPSRPR
jgi:hypothetical protein